MPTVKPRINITLQPERYDLLRRLSSLQGSSMASIVVEVMDSVYPVLERVVIVLEAAKNAQTSQKEGMRKAVEAAEVEMMPHMYDAISQFDMFIDEAAKATGADLTALKSSEEVLRKIMSADDSKVGGITPPEAGTDTGGVIPPAVPSPRICNTGVRSEKPNKIKGAKK